MYSRFGMDSMQDCGVSGLEINSVRPNMKLVLVIGRAGHGVEWIHRRRAAQSESHTLASPNPVMKSFSAYMHFRLQQRNKGGKEYVPAHRSSSKGFHGFAIKCNEHHAIEAAWSAN